VPNGNTVYTYYGCNNHDVRVFGIDAGDSKSYVQGWMSTNSAAYPCTYSTTANDAVCTNYNPGGYYPQVFIVKQIKHILMLVVILLLKLDLL